MNEMNYRLNDYYNICTLIYSDYLRVARDNINQGCGFQGITKDVEKITEDINEIMYFKIENDEDLREKNENIEFEFELMLKNFIYKYIKDSQ